MKLRTVIYTLLLATLCMGCGNTLSMRELERLEARMNDAPDSPIELIERKEAPTSSRARCIGRQCIG